MSIDIRLPNINGKTEAEQLSQIKSYLYQFAGQLQWALSSVNTGNSSNVVLQKNGTGSVAKSDSAVDNFNELKDLIIKSADIVEAYYHKIDNLLKLNGDYTASSDFGTFKEQTQNSISATDKKISQNITDLQAIYDTDGKLRTELLINGCIYAGIIEYAESGEAIVGIQVGQTTIKDGKEVFNQFARFTANELSFYDANATKVAYISDSKMVITHAWVTGDLRVGSRFKFDTSNGIALIPVIEEE